MYRQIPDHEPYKIKTVRRVPFPTPGERRNNLIEAHFNVLRLRPSQVTFDMIAWGASAVSQVQRAGLQVGDEAYAGARNFEALERAVREVLGHGHVCPTHNLLGCLKLLVATMVPEGGGVVSNGLNVTDALSPRGVPVHDGRDHGAPIFTGDLDLERVERRLSAGDVAILYVEAFADAHYPISLGNLRAARALADRHKVPLVLDGSRITENAWYVQRHEDGHGGRSVAELVRDMVACCHVLQLDGAQDARTNVGALLSTDDADLYERLMNEVVVYEGLHTYGGMAGRTMEVFARGLTEMVREEEAHWIMRQAERFTERLQRAGVPLDRGCDGAYLLADAFLPHVPHHAKDALAAALYQTTGVRAAATGMLNRDNLLPVQIPRLAMTNRQLDQVADAVIALFRQRDRVAPLEPAAEARWRDQMRYRSVFADLEPFEFRAEPHIIHTFEQVGDLSRDARAAAIRDAGWNTFLLRSEDVTIDLLTDSGTTAMSTEQWSLYESARPSVANSDEYTALVEVIREVFGYQYVLPTHQGRAAEHILSQVAIKPGQIVPGNMYFTTTKLHQEMAGGVFADVIVDEAHDPSSTFRWKGNIDLAKLEALVAEHGVERIAYVSFEHSVNMAGGQPVSMDNMREVYAWCAPRGIKVFFDATRVAENACMIQLRDPRYARTPARDILREMMLYGDGCTVSGKKDFLINMGGVLAFRDDGELAARAEEMLRVYEGNVTDGGLPAADLAAMAQGVREMLDDRYLRDRISQTAALGQRLMEGGVPIVTPPGSHAIFVDARRFLPHVDQDDYPAQRLAAEIYVETGVRAMERGNVSKGRDPRTGENYRPALELVRLTLSRRVYTDDHLRAVAEGVIRLYERRESIGGLRFVYEPERLRFFQGRFEPTDREAARVPQIRTRSRGLGAGHERIEPAGQRL
jgi:tyrosine phenol-lyase